MATRLKDHIRLMWPDRSVRGAARYKAMLMEYRGLAKQLQDRHAEVVKLLRHVDVAAVGDTLTAAAVYQEALSEQPGDQVGELDRRFAEWGERWHLDEDQVVEFTFDDDDLLPIKDASHHIGKEFGMQSARGAGGHWLGKARALGRIVGIKDDEASWLMRAGDVRKLLRDYDGQGWRAGNADAVPGPAVVTTFGGKSYTRKPAGRPKP